MFYFICIYISEYNYYKYDVHLTLEQRHWRGGSSTNLPAFLVCHIIAQCENTGYSTVEFDGACGCVKVIFIW